MNEGLVREVSKLLREAGVADSTALEQHENRFWWDRARGSVRRYVRIVPLTDEKTRAFTGSFSVLFGQNTGSGRTDFENFDARRWGDLDNVLDSIRKWLVDWVPLETMTPPP